MLKVYYHLAKPGIVYGNMLSTLAGFFLAAQGELNWGRLLAVLSGTALVIAAGCVFNNYIDRGIDAKMARTAKRALVSGKVSGRSAIIYGAVLAALGFAILLLFTNLPTVLTGLVGIFFYVVVYGVAKRRSTLGTVVGSIPGATPPLAGYLAVGGNFDTGAVLVFLIMAIWQMPHFYAIAIFRLKDYRAAGLPVLPVKRGIARTKLYILLYILAYVAVAPLLTFFGYAGYLYALVMITAGLAWLMKGVNGFKTNDDPAWARKMFGFSLLVLLLFSLTVIVDSLLAWAL